MRQAFRTMRRMKAEAGGKGGAGALAASSAFALPPSSTEEVGGWVQYPAQSLVFLSTGEEEVVVL